jgi:hypothetical protein
MNTGFVRFILILISILTVMAPIASSAQTESHLSLQFKMVEKLIKTSSGAVQIDQSNISEAILLRNEAERNYEQAREAQRVNDDQRALELLDDAAAKMFRAIRLATSDKRILKQRVDLEKRSRGVEALLAAYERVSREKNELENFTRVKRQVEEYRSQAAILDEEDQPEGALVMMSQAYRVLKSALEELRGGETLVRSLTFSSKAEEYAYELDRNNTHMMLMSVLAEDKKPSATVEKFLNDARSLRLEAEADAAKNDYAAAIDKLGTSTRALIRAIRMSGIYIPG